ncbi:MULTISPECIES: endonuclease/exonuclease/phosphatase family protein [unclassified Streptomyces]|uniref:endonuclease/exonuclease/phosphatase family protein n=1 Tax=unclassified Streptomyces TaxID=2593676 RepID=UPI002E1491AC|nr:endonuclease/exonuclease/phosphatase family protein [Streptomyces sp. NBC_01243]
MFRRVVSWIAAFAAISGVALTFAPAASAADTEAIAKSAGQKWALKSEATGKYVSTEIKDGDNQWAKLRARSDTTGAWERFTLHTDDEGRTVSLRFEASGYFASTEIEDGGAHDGMLRARGAKIGGWERFTLGSLGDGKYTLKGQTEGLYVSAEKDATGNDYGLLRARSGSVGSWERFTLVKAGAAGIPADTTDAGSAVPPLAGPAAASTARVMSWNVCGNINTVSPCNGGRPIGKDALTAGLKDRLAKAASYPDVIFLQEICEKHAKPVELALEEGPYQWDVRFAPINYDVDGTGLKAQKECMDADGYDRGAYGVAIAVPDENAWYQAYDLPSPATYVNKDGVPRKAEQRTAVCASVPSRAAMFCAAHFSTGGKGWDDPERTWQKKQAATLMEKADQRGYRPVFGGDLNVSPPARGLDVLTPVYDRYQECAEQNGVYDGPNTKDGEKIDYIFSPFQFSACSVETYVGLSDHFSIHGSVPLPAR